MARRSVDWFVAAGLLIAFELFLVLALNRSRIASVWEVQYGLLWLSPTLILVAIVGSICGGLLLVLAERSETRSARTLLAVLLGAFGAAVGFGVGGGRHLGEPVLRVSFAAAIGLLGAAAALAVAPSLARGIARRPALVGALALFTIVVLEIANRYLFVRRYAAFHVGLAAAALIVAPALTLIVPAQPARALVARPWGLLVSGALVLLAAVLARPAAARLAYFDNLRLLLVEQAPLGGHGVLLAARLAPPAPPPAACEPSDADCVFAEPSERSAAHDRLNLSGRDILLVTIDALRADHVGIHGYRRPTTPEIDRLAREGVYFDYAYAATPHTSYSVTSLMTGKYMRPLLLQGEGQDSDTFATLLRTYGYRSAAFYPPAVFFIDPARFEGFRSSFLGFEFRKVEFLEGEARVRQVEEYVRGQPPGQRLFLWVHLFGPHEPYEAQPGHAFGERDIDRYDSEIAAADATLGRLVRALRQRQPQSVVIVSADHGEEFGDHGGRYHGTSVYEEQVRVPLVISAKDAIFPRRIREPVQIIDVLPTLLGALDIPRPPRLRGRDLGELIRGARAEGPGLVHAETDEQALMGEGTLRLICQRKLGACQLYDLSVDPHQQGDASAAHPGKLVELRTRLREFGASHGRFEVRGLRKEGKGWPAPIARGIAGDADAGEEIASLLDDADLGIRRKAAELLFELKRKETAPALRLTLGRDDDADVKAYSALALTRLGEGAPLAFELAKSPELRWRRLAALALAESGDARGEEALIAWWMDAAARDHARSRDLLAALAQIRSKDAVWPIVQSLDDVRLRPYIAAALAAIGEEAARGPLSRALASERYQSARVALLQALVKLKAEGEIIEPLVRFLGVPDPLPGGLKAALDTGNLEHVGGPNKRDLARLRRQSELGVAVLMVIPRGPKGRGVRAVIRARAEREPGVVRIGARVENLRYDRQGKPIRKRDIPRLDSARHAVIRVPKGPDFVEVHGELPGSIGAQPGRQVEVVVVADRHVEVDAVALIPLSNELPPPPPEPWKPGSADSASPRQ